jgi:hypothetical protein
MFIVTTITFVVYALYDFGVKGKNMIGDQMGGNVDF